MIEPNTSHVPEHLKAEYAYIYQERYMIMTQGKYADTAQKIAAQAEALKDAEAFLKKNLPQREFGI